MTKRAMLIGFLFLSIFNFNCGDNQTVWPEVIDVHNVDDDQTTPSGNGGGEDLDNCAVDKDCASEYQVCEVEMVRGHRSGVCVTGCQVQKETQFGTTCRIAGTDSCQREGDDLLFCDETNHKCRYMTEEEVEAGKFPLICEEKGEGEGSEGEGEGGGDIGGVCSGTNPDCEEPVPGNTELKCCLANYSASHPARWMQFSASTSRPANPGAWVPGTDRVIGSDGCATMTLDYSTVVVGPWCEATTMRRAESVGHPTAWLGTSAPMRAAYIGGQSVGIDYFECGRGYRMHSNLPHDPNCVGNVTLCAAPNFSGACH